MEGVLRSVIQVKVIITRSSNKPCIQNVTQYKYIIRKIFPQLSFYKISALVGFKWAQNSLNFNIIKYAIKYQMITRKRQKTSYLIRKHIFKAFH